MFYELLKILIGVSWIIIPMGLQWCGDRGIGYSGSYSFRRYANDLPPEPPEVPKYWASRFSESYQSTAAPITDRHFSWSYTLAIPTPTPTSPPEMAPTATWTNEPTATIIPEDIEDVMSIPLPSSSLWQWFFEIALEVLHGSLLTIQRTLLNLALLLPQNPVFLYSILQQLYPYEKTTIPANDESRLVINPIAARLAARVVRQKKTHQEAMAANDELIYQQGQLLAMKDWILGAKDLEINTLQVAEQELSARKNTDAAWATLEISDLQANQQRVLAEKDRGIADLQAANSQLLAERDNAMAEKDEALRSRDTEIANLQDTNRQLTAQRDDDRRALATLRGEFTITSQQLRQLQSQAQVPLVPHQQFNYGYRGDRGGGNRGGARGGFGVRGRSDRGRGFI